MRRTSGGFGAAGNNGAQLNVNGGVLQVDSTAASLGTVVNINSGTLAYRVAGTISGLLTVGTAGTMDLRGTVPTGSAVNLTGGLALQNGALLGFDLGTSTDVLNIGGVGFSHAGSAGALIAAVEAAEQLRSPGLHGELPGRS